MFIFFFFSVKIPETSKNCRNNVFRRKIPKPFCDFDLFWLEKFVKFRLFFPPCFLEKSLKNKVSLGIPNTPKMTTTSQTSKNDHIMEFAIILDGKLLFFFTFTHYRCIFHFCGVESAPKTIDFEDFLQKTNKKMTLFFLDFMNFQNPKQWMIQNYFAFFVSKIWFVPFSCVFRRVYKNQEKI